MTAAEANADTTGMTSGIPVGSVRGVALRLNWSVAIIAALITWSLADTVFPDLVEDRSTSAYWVTGAITSALFFASLLAHELGHSLVALRAGIGVRSITLWLFGGVAQLEDKPERPGDALRIAAAGPAVSAAIGLVCLAIGGAFLDGLPRAAVIWLGAMNLLLMGFNLLPAFPLDGGRIYQAWLWQRSGDEIAATTKAVNAGLTTGAVLVGLGVAQLLFGALIGGIWMMAIGWFVREAARAEWRGVVIEDRLAPLTVADVMSPNPETVPATMSLDEFVAGLLRSGRHGAYPVVDGAGIVVGVVTLSDIRQAGSADSDRTIADVAAPRAGIPTAAPDTPLRDLLSRLGGKPHARALIFAGEDLVGIVSPSDLARLWTIVELEATRQA